MANNPFFSDATVKASVDAVAALCNGGTLKIYDGAQPTDANTAVGTQTQLAALTLGSPAFAASAASGAAPSRLVTASANAITGDSSADATGTAAWFRVLKSDGVTVVFDGSVGVADADLNLVTTSIVAGEPVNISSFSITQNE